MLDLVARLQGYLRYRARENHDVVVRPPFTLFLHPEDISTDASYAIPDAPSAGRAPDVGVRLRAAFAERRRKACIRFLAEYAPALAPALRAAGFAEAERLQVMACTPGGYCLPPDVPGLRVLTLSATSPRAELRECLEVNTLGFDPVSVPVTEGAIEDYCRRLGAGSAFLARLEGRAVAVATCREAHAGVTELVGITTIMPYRRRGIGAALTAYAACTAFASGAEIVFLIAAHEAASRVYGRVGFAPCATLLEYIDRA